MRVNQALNQKIFLFVPWSWPLSPIVCEVQILVSHWSVSKTAIWLVTYLFLTLKARPYFKRKCITFYLPISFSQGDRVNFCQDCWQWVFNGVRCEFFTHLILANNSINLKLTFIIAIYNMYKHSIIMLSYSMNFPSQANMINNTIERA